MEFLSNAYAWYLAHGSDVATFLLLLPPVMEAAVRIWPTEKGEGFVHRIGEIIDSLLKFLPNNVKK